MKRAAFYLAASAASVLLSAELAYADDGGDCGRSYTTPFHILLRSDFNDLGPLSCTHSQVAAQGATFSYGNNLLTGQNSAAADGLVALEYSYVDRAATLFKAAAIGVYTQGDDTYQFQPTSTQAYNGYTLTPGGFAEVVLVNPVFGYGSDDFRIRDGEAIASTGTRSNSFVGEWIPSYRLGNQLQLALPTQLGSAPIMYTFTPELMVQHDQFDSGPKTASLFASRNQALRIGPQFQLILTPDSHVSDFLTGVGQPGNLAPGDLASMLQRLSLTLTNHESWDQYTGREFSWSSIALGYTFAPWLQFPNAPSFGLSASFGVGNSEATGNYMKQFKIGLAAKL
ncbi:hypothetical protein [Bradyrhizobium genosp. P]|uniref:hypothetical protein n=1 Tax=Bradyrhizobium genosp. P TaxID=83641 RepID=UPI003CFADA0D